MDEEQAMNLIVNGFVKEVVNKLPMEFAVEANKLLEVTLEGSVGQLTYNHQLCIINKNNQGVIT